MIASYLEGAELVNPQETLMSRGRERKRKERKQEEEF